MNTLTHTLIQTFEIGYTKIVNVLGSLHLGTHNMINYHIYFYTTTSTRAIYYSGTGSTRQPLAVLLVLLLDFGLFHLLRYLF